MNNIFSYFSIGLIILGVVVLLIWGISKKSSTLEFNGNVSIKIDNS